jgi:type 1 glutamine amidotransferase
VTHLFRAAGAAVLLLTGCRSSKATDPTPPTPAASCGPEAGSPTKRVLVFDKCRVYCHASIPYGVQALEELACGAGMAMDATDDAGVFTMQNLARYDAVVFLSTTAENDVLHPFDAWDAGRSGDYAVPIMTADQKAAFEDYISHGGGYVGIHAASDGDYAWPFYVDMLGAMFSDHASPGDFQTATLDVEDPSHPATTGVPRPWSRSEEWYNFDRNPRAVARILLTLDESTYAKGPKACVRDHPMAWCRDYKGARVFYTALGHTPESWSEPAFRAHLLGALQWATRLADGDCSPRGRPDPLPNGSATCSGAACFEGCRCGSDGDGGAPTCRATTGHDRLPPPNCGGILCDDGCSCVDASKSACNCPSR